MHNLDFRNRSLNELTDFFSTQRLNQVQLNHFFQLLREQAVTSLNELEAPKELKKVAGRLPFAPLQFVKSVKDSQSNEKFVFKTNDGYLIETLFMPRKDEPSVCVSCQIGCRWQCRFCCSGTIKHVRSLYPHEIIEQVRQISLIKSFKNNKATWIRNVGFMGMGEPFDNLANCMQAVEYFNSHWGWQISRQKCTFSTSGSLPFDAFFSYAALPNLALSLHSANQEKRLYLMPAAKIPLTRLKESLIEYCHRTKKQVTIEYCLFDGINDSEQDALELIDYLRDVPFKKINLLGFNTFPAGTEAKVAAAQELKPVNEEKIAAFRAFLKAHQISTFYRKSSGTEIGAGCGQLGASLSPPSSC